MAPEMSYTGNAVRHSFTALKQFEFCERQFYFQRILGLPETPGPQLAVGIAYHAALEAAMRTRRVPLTEVTDLRLAGEAVEKSKLEKGWCDPGVPDGVLVCEIADNLGRLRPLLSVLEPVTQNGQDLIEVWGNRFTCKVDLITTGTPVHEAGTILRMDEGPCVVDWKTTAKETKRYKKDHSMQLALYCLEFGCKAGCIVEIPRNPLCDLFIEVLHFDDYDLARWEKFFVAQFAAMSSRGQSEEEYKLAVRGHGLCSPTWCHWWDLCPGGGKK